MIISQLLNNNAIIAKNYGKEVIVIGTGVGYKAKVGQKVDEAKVQKVFYLNETSNKLLDLIREIPDVYLEITELMISFAETKGISFLNTVYVQMTDHIYHAVEHEKQGIIIRNDLYSMYKRYYPTEFEVALYVRKLVKEKIGFDLSEDEVGFIVFHIVESSKDYNRYEVEKEIKFINESVDFIRNNAKVPLEEDSMNFDRLVIHLKFLSNRYFKGEDEKNEINDEIMNDLIEKSMPEEYDMACRFNDFFYQKYGKQYTRQELNYLTLHFRNSGIR